MNLRDIGPWFWTFVVVVLLSCFWSHEVFLFLAWRQKRWIQEHKINITSVHHQCDVHRWWNEEIWLWIELPECLRRQHRILETNVVSELLSKTQQPQSVHSFWAEVGHKELQPLCHGRRGRLWVCLQRVDQEYRRSFHKAWSCSETTQQKRVAGKISSRKVH